MKWPVFNKKDLLRGCRVVKMRKDLPKAVFSRLRTDLPGAGSMFFRHVCWAILRCFVAAEGAGFLSF